MKNLFVPSNYSHTGENEITAFRGFNTEEIVILIID
jgi:hypothetical protein